MPPAVDVAGTGTMTGAVTRPLAVFIVLSSMPRLMMRNIDVFVPSILYKIDRAIASIVLSAVSFPFFLMPRGHAQVNGFMHDVNRRLMHDHRARINDFRLREVPDIDAAVKTRLADTHGNTDIGGLSRNGNQSQHDNQQHFFHRYILS